MNASFAVYVKLIASLNALVKKKQLDRTTSIDIPTVIVLQATRWGLDKSAIKALKRYIENQSTPTSEQKITTKIDTEKLRDSTQMVYEMLCNTLGPVEADSLFAEAIKKTETIRAAKIFSPRDLL